MQWLAGGVGFVLGSSVITSYVQIRGARRQKTSDRMFDIVAKAQEALEAMRDGHLRYARQLPDAPDDATLAQLTTHFDQSMVLTFDEEIVTAARTYRDIAAQWASGDPLVGVSDEQSAYDDLCDTLRRKLKKKA